MTTVDLAQLREHLTDYLRRAQRGERLLVTDRNRPLAELGPPAATVGALDRLIADGRVYRARRDGLPKPLDLGSAADALSIALDEVRGLR